MTIASPAAAQGGRAYLVGCAYVLVAMAASVALRAWADAALAAYVEGGVAESRLTAWRWHLQQLLGSIGGISGADAPVKRWVRARRSAGSSCWSRRK